MPWPSNVRIRTAHLQQLALSHIQTSLYQAINIVFTALDSNCALLYPPGKEISCSIVVVMKMRHVRSTSDQILDYTVNSSGPNSL